MKIKLGLAFLIISVLVLGACSTWAGDEGIVNIRIVGDSETSGGSNSRAINPDASIASGTELTILYYDIYFVKATYKEGDKIPKDNIVGGRGVVKYGTNVACSMVPGTWILIICATEGPRGKYVAQGKSDVEIKPGRNEDITITMSAPPNYYKGTNF